MKRSSGLSACFRRATAAVATAAALNAVVQARGQVPVPAEPVVPELREAAVAELLAPEADVERVGLTDPATGNLVVLSATGAEGGKPQQTFQQALESGLGLFPIRNLRPTVPAAPGPAAPGAVVAEPAVIGPVQPAAAEPAAAKSATVPVVL